MNAWPPCETTSDGRWLISWEAKNQFNYVFILYIYYQYMYVIICVYIYINTTNIYIYICIIVCFLNILCVYIVCKYCVIWDKINTNIQNTYTVRIVQVYSHTGVDEYGHVKQISLKITKHMLPKLLYFLYIRMIIYLHI